MHKYIKLNYYYFFVEFYGDLLFNGSIEKRKFWRDKK